MLVLLWAIFLVAVPFVTWSCSDQVAFEPKGARPAEQDGTTYLLVGSDSRADLTAAERKRLATGNPESALTDTIMILHTGDGPNVLISIPRDTITDSSRYGVSKINAAYASGGVPLLTRIVEDTTGIRIDTYVEIGLGGVAVVVDAVGGVEVNAKERLNDDLAGINIKKGRQTLDGAEALGYARSRKVSQLGDLERVTREGRAGREAEAARAETLVEEAIQAFDRTLAVRDAGPDIARLRTHLEAQIRAAVGDLPDAEAVARRVAGRLLHAPSEALRRRAAEGRLDDDTRALIAELFELGDGTRGDAT